MEKKHKEEESEGNNQAHILWQRRIRFSYWSKACIWKMNHTGINYSCVKMFQSLRYLDHDWSTYTLCWFIDYVITQDTLMNICMKDRFLILLIIFLILEYCISITTRGLIKTSQRKQHCFLHANRFLQLDSCTPFLFDSLNHWQQGVLLWIYHYI